jgi:hypothetical protein
MLCGIVVMKGGAMDWIIIILIWVVAVYWVAD